MSSNQLSRAKHIAPERFVVGECQGILTEFFGAQQQLFQRRGAIVERIIAVAMQCGIKHLRDLEHVYNYRLFG
jgi:hypothetical protein